MGVYVKNMTFPKSCSVCDFKSVMGYCRRMPPEFYGCTRDEGHPDWCPLIEVTVPHGQLIDVDELIEDLKHDVAIDQDSLDYEELTEINRRLTQADKDVKQNAIDLLEHTRCIIEAEGAEE